MKISNYTIFVPYGKYMIGYNTIKDAFIYLPEKEYHKLFVEGSITTEESPYYVKLVENGFLIPEEQDEFQELIEEYNKEVQDSPIYHLTLLPSLDCNLRCWYCFEQHIKGSRMLPDVQTGIINHVISTFEQNSNLTMLAVELFGGEPLLYFKEELFPLLRQIKTYLEEIGKTVYFTFVTNAVCITEEFIPLFKNLGNVGFQISIDGYKDKHDKVKFIPETREGTYDRVIHTVYQLTQELENAFVNLRINYDDKTLSYTESLIKDLVDVDRRKITIHLERVWQTGTHLNRDNETLKQVIKLFLVNGFRFSYMNLFRRSYPCKTSKKDHVTISYDGKIYKCTGRNFTDEMQEGMLLPDGSIKWDEEKLAKRMAIKSYDNELCRACKLLPLCWGPCNQKLLESGTSKEAISRYCQKNLMEMSLNDYICFRFNNELLNQKQYETELS